MSMHPSRREMTEEAPLGHSSRRKMDLEWPWGRPQALQAVSRHNKEEHKLFQDLARGFLSLVSL